MGVRVFSVTAKGFFLAAGLLLAGSFVNTAEAGNIHKYKDTLSNSAPGEYSNHTVEFQTKVAIPAGGFIRFTPEPGEFTIPATDFSINNVELHVANPSNYVPRLLSTTTSATEDGVAITPGVNGAVEITLNSSDGIPANAFVRILLGTHTQNATGTDLGILNDSATGTKSFVITIGSGVTSESTTGRVAIIESVSIPNIDTREFDPPVRFGGAPSGTISGTSLAVQVSLQTDEFARCRYSTASGTPYFSISNQFSSNFTTIHTMTFAVATSTTYTFYVRCIDDESNFNTDDYIITFTVPEYPSGTPGSEGSNEGEGSGTGEGSGEATPGDGDPSGGDDTSGGNASGGGGGGGGGGGSGTSSGGDDGGGGFEGTDQPYQSGDGLVIITGLAYPGSRVTALVDGQVATQVTAAGSGAFSITLSNIARGAYTFGVYAIDGANVRSTTFSTTFTVTGSRGSTLSNINIMPSIKVTPDPVTPGQTVVFSGYAIPNATITIENQLDKSAASLKTLTSTSNSQGLWSLEVNTTGFTPGTYKVRAKSVQTGGASTNFSGYTFYGVGQAAAVSRSSDLNRDGKVNLTDFSILLFWWGSDGGASDPPADINGDGRVSLTDFSILVFNWTG